MGLEAKILIDDKPELWVNNPFAPVPRITQVVDFPRITLIGFFNEEICNESNQVEGGLSFLFDYTEAEVEGRIYKLTPDEINLHLKNYERYLINEGELEEGEEYIPNDDREIFITKLFEYMPKYYVVYIIF